MMHIVIKEERRKPKAQAADVYEPTGKMIEAAIGRAVPELRLVRKAPILPPQEPRPLALPMNADLRTPNGKAVNGMPQFDVTPQPPQLHTQGAKITDWTNIAYAAEWDGVSPWITVLTGDKASIKMRYMGWPDCTKEEWGALHPVVPPTL